MLPPPTTMATSMPPSRTSLISPAMRRTMAGSRPYGRVPIRASPESFRRMRFQRGVGDKVPPLRGSSVGGARTGRGDAHLALAQDEAHEAPDADVLSGLGDHRVDDVLHGARGVAHE